VASVGVTIDCNDLTAMTNFWIAALGYTRGGLDGNYQWIADPDGEGPNIILQLVPEPRVGKNRLHLDIYANDIDHEARRLIGIGAAIIDVVPQEEVGHRWIRLTDPEGNEFCVVQA
jgi:predicted enzyme related to lactoylglutathione lyase